MPRAVTSELDLRLETPTALIFSISAAAQSAPVLAETFTFRSGGRDVSADELVEPDGSRLHLLHGEPGPLTIRYDALIGEVAATPAPIGDALERIRYLRPSRYCQSDEVFAQARRQFAGLTGFALLDAIVDYVERAVTYSPGLSLGTDSAVSTLATGQGVCRDYAHVVIAMLRAMDVPARYAACYAPGLVPMDFHAVAEAFIDGAWWVVDATRLAPRHALVRIATGRDAADCAFLTFHGGTALLERMIVDAWLAPAPGERMAPAPEDRGARLRLA